MIGRAGRAGFDDKSGESVLILQHKDSDKVFPCGYHMITCTCSAGSGVGTP